MISNWEKY